MRFARAAVVALRLACSTATLRGAPGAVASRAPLAAEAAVDAPRPTFRPTSPSDDGGRDDDPSFVHGYFFVLVVVVTLFGGCACLTANGCEADSVSLPQRRGHLSAADEHRFVLLRDSLVERGEAQWTCCVCAFANAPRAAECALCGAAAALSNDFDDRLGRRRQSESSRASHDSRVAVERISVDGRAVQRRGGWRALSPEERAQAFMVRRLNNLTLTQKGAARRHIWRRRRSSRTGALMWSRQKLSDVGPPSPASSGARPRGGGGLEEGLLDSSDDEARGHSLAFVASLAEHADDVRWSLVDSAPSEASAPRAGPRERSCWLRVCCDRYRVSALYDKDGPDLEFVASAPFNDKEVWLERSLDSLHGILAHDTLRQRRCRPLTMEVRRAHVVADSLRRFEGVSLDRLRGSALRARFRGEAGVDAGGIAREWFHVVASEMFSVEFGLFECRREAGHAQNVNPASGAAAFEAFRRRGRTRTISQARYFRFAGRFVAKAIRERVALPLTLALPLLKHVLSVPLSFSDLEYVDAESFQSYAWLRDNAGAEALSLDFTVQTSDGTGKVLELLPGGAGIAVTDDNKAHYLACVLRYRVLDSVKAQLVAFLKGFDDVLPREVLCVFDYQELQLLVGGQRTIDVDDWRRHTRYLGAFASLGEKHGTVANFWRCVEKFDATDRARLCQFATGTPQLPPSGFKALVGDDGRFCNFTLTSLPRALGVWPRAHTCFNRIDLPLYESLEELESYLSLSIQLEVLGFTID
ncbi:hypothetical protein M885DRAFT_582335 [Pelagophyceae sp. CCMP2097]|nr:hypothetical protein M885DRAFT_582335 [Pelagophyceae sp. CCMP2097]